MVLEAVVEIDAHGSVQQARVAVGACSAVAQRLRALEHDLKGAVARPGLGKLVRLDHLDALAPIDDLRGTADYRRDATVTLVRRVLDACLADTGAQA